MFCLRLAMTTRFGMILTHNLKLFQETFSGTIQLMLKLAFSCSKQTMMNASKNEFIWLDSVHSKYTIAKERE